MERGTKHDNGDNFLNKKEKNSRGKRTPSSDTKQIIST